jgi:hypothetical protein
VGVERIAKPPYGRNNVTAPRFGKVVPGGWLWTFARRMLNFIRAFRLGAQERGVLAMIVARSHLFILAGAALLALLALAGCKGVADSTTYPDRPVPPAPPYFFGVWGSGPSDVYAVGQPGLIYHFDGTSWQRQACPTAQPLTSVWGDPESGRVYVTGHDGVILRNTGNGVWTSMNSGTGADLFDVGAFIQEKPAGQTRFILAVGDEGTILRLVGDGWQPAPTAIMVRNNLNAPEDTLTLSHDMVSLTTVFTYGVGGAYVDRRAVGGGVKGCVLLNDPDLDWQLRPIAGGESWVTSSVGGESTMDNFVGTASGRLFQLTMQAENVEAFVEMYSPSLGEIVYGVWADAEAKVNAVSNAGRVTWVTPPPDNDHADIYYDGLTLFDIWGTSSTNLYAVGINGRIMHYYDAAGGDNPQWVRENVELPAAKSLVAGGLDKFGRPF